MLFSTESSSAYTQPPSSSNSATPGLYGHNSIEEAIRMQREAALNSQIVPNRKLLDLPEFCGKLQDWPIFYIANIESTAAYNYTNFENNQRLNKCLKGETRELIKALLIYPSNKCCC